MISAMRASLRIRSDEEQRSTNLELFFDLVFVFALTQVSTLLARELNWTGAGSALFLLLVAWWAWIYTTWMTNWFDPDAAAVRVVLLCVMLAGLLMSIAIPRAFGALGLMFALAYVALQLVRNAFIVVGTDRAEPLHPSFKRILAWSAWTGALWIAGGVLAGEARVIVWLVALICDYAGPFAGYWTPGLGRSATSDWELEHAHFVERFQLFILIALGESITATGASAAAHSHLGGGRIAAIAVGFAITAAAVVAVLRPGSGALSRGLRRRRGPRPAWPRRVHLPAHPDHGRDRPRRCGEQDRDRQAGCGARCRPAFDHRRGAGTLPRGPPRLPRAHDRHPVCN
jgi:low temperature requirement protein LtrA